MKIVIIGAGISGCTAYLLLKKHLPHPLSTQPHSITIYEAHDARPDATRADRDFGGGGPHSSTLVVGGGLGVGANGLHVLRRLDEDLLRDVVSHGYVAPTVLMRARSGAVLGRLQPTGPPATDDDAAADADIADMHMVAISRHALWRCLRTRVPDAAVVTKRVANVIANAEGLNLVTFTDGSTVEADLVIGADGLKSLTRRALFPEADQDPFPAHFEGLAGVGGFIPSSNLLNHVEPGTMNLVFGGTGFFGYFFAESDAASSHRDSPFHVSDPGRRLAWWSTYTFNPNDDTSLLENPTKLDPDLVAAQLRHRLAHWRDPVVRRVLDPENHHLRIDSVYPTWTVPPLPTWERDGVVLVGDAAHALPPTSGQGSSQALEDVEALALLIAHHLRCAYRRRDAADTAVRKRVVKEAAKQYVDLRLPRATRILKEARSMQNTKRDMSFLQECLMYIFMWLMGCFPTVMTKSLAAVVRYNVAEEVKKVLGKEGLWRPSSTSQTLS